MNGIIKKVYITSPFFIKKFFANIEALRRNSYRRSGDYSKYYNHINISKTLTTYSGEKQLLNMNKLLKYVSNTVPYYMEQLDFEEIKHLGETTKIPLTNKELMKKDINSFINPKHRKKLWSGKTSGSTGVPFNYYRDKASMQFEYALYDKLYIFFAGSKKNITARMSGVNIVPVGKKNPPFWYFIKTFNQLQCSAYHIDSKSVGAYIKAFNSYNVDIGTGYANSWLYLSQFVNEGNEKKRKLKAIITDSEGVSTSEKKEIETAFNCSVYQTYGISETGMVAVQCEKNHYHTFAERCLVEIIDGDGNNIIDGKLGEIVITDLKSYNSPFIRYRTGDLGSLGNEDCGCGWHSPYLKELSGRIDDYIITKDGRKLSGGGLTHISKPAKGIIGMQLLQSTPGELMIKVLPGENFEPKSMDDVITLAKDYLGDMDLDWSVVDKLQKTTSGKTKYIIRNLKKL